MADAPDQEASVVDHQPGDCSNWYEFVTFQARGRCLCHVERLTLGSRMAIRPGATQLAYRPDFSLLTS